MCIYTLCVHMHELVYVYIYIYIYIYICLYVDPTTTQNEITTGLV